MKPQRRASKAEIERIRDLIQHMTPRSEIYQVLRDELTSLGYWRNKPRGKPGFKDGSKDASETRYEPIEEF